MAAHEKDAAAFMAELAADPDYQRRISAMDAEHDRIVAVNRAAAEPLATDLRALGFDVAFPEDLYTYDYRTAIPVLIDWLPRIDNADVKSSIARALAVEWARSTAAAPLVLEFDRTIEATGVESERLRYDLANALDVVADHSVASDLMRFIDDNRVEDETRGLLLSALGQSGSVEVARFVSDRIEGEQTPVVLIGGLIALRRIGDNGTKFTVQNLAKHLDRDVRREAARTLKVLDRTAKPRRLTE